MKKDEDQKFELVIIYMLCGCAGIVIAALARLSALKLGLDVFTANLVFVVFIAIAVSIFQFFANLVFVFLIIPTLCLFFLPTRSTFFLILLLIFFACGIS